MWKILIDQTGREVHLSRRPERIISLVPSQTELLHYLGQDVAGITKFCVHPHNWFKTKPRIGGTKNLNLEKIRELAPDLVIANKEENNREDVEAISAFCPVWTSDILTVEDAFRMIVDLGSITGTEARAGELVGRIRESFAAIKPVGKKAVYLIWKKPYMAAGNTTFIHDMMLRAGLRNAVHDQHRYPQVKMEDLRGKNVELILLSSEPYPFKIRDISELNKILPEARVLLVDGELFSWYGSRMLHFADYVNRLFWH